MNHMIFNLIIIVTIIYSSNFQSKNFSFWQYCCMITQCDQGANVGSVTDLQYFIIYVQSDSAVQQVGGDMIH